MSRVRLTEHSYRYLYDPPQSSAVEDLVVELPNSPAFPQIVKALRDAKRLGFNVMEPEMLKRAIKAGEQAHKEEALRELARQEAMERRCIEGLNELKMAATKHVPVVYYMKLGDLVKIGTTTRIAQRRATINPEVILAIEVGDRELETQRHRDFRDLWVHGEWFKLHDRLASHIETARDRFESHLGTTVEGWLQKVRA